MTNLGRFPFGAPVLPCGAELPEPCDAFVLGAYPSAVHVRWTPPKTTGLKPISALAIDNEPSVFWDGSDAQDRVERWKAQYFDPAWGNVAPAALNGPSGAWLRTHILDPLGAADVGSHFVTDCLTTYRLSTGAASRLHDTYQRMVEQTPGLESAQLQDHPSETQIVQESLQAQATRLTNQIVAAQPQLIITLGNAAARVINSLAGRGGRGTLTPDTYGHSVDVTISRTRTKWVALVHPATPPLWQTRHQQWLASSGFSL